MSRDSLNDANPPSRRRWVGTEPPKRDDTDDLAAKPKSKTAAAAQRKWDFQEITRVVDEALTAGKNPRLVLISRYEVNDAMSYYLMKQVKKLRNPVHLPKPPVDTGRSTPDDALAAIEGSAAA